MTPIRLIALLILTLTSTLAISAESAPTPRLVPQALDITHGQVYRPEGWYYSWFTTANAIVWTVAKQDAAKGPYETGMRIHFMPAASAGTGKSAEQMARDFLAKKTASSRVVKQCEESTAGRFRRICLETLEPSPKAGSDFHILYSVSWNTERDWFVITIFGAPANDWESLTPTVNAMADIMLVGEQFYREHNAGTAQSQPAP